MKKHFVMIVALLIAVMIAAPALAVEFKYGGQFRVRALAEDNKYDGIDTGDGFTVDRDHYAYPYNTDDQRNFIDQRLRLYFSFIASQNLKVVTKFEMGDIVWGNPGGRVGPSSGGGVGADGVNVELKNAYVEFNIPMTPSTAIVGIQTLTLMDSWIVDDDFSAATIVTKLDPVTVTAAYIAGQNGGVGDTDFLAYTDQEFNIDSFFLALDYAGGPFKASLVGFYQYGHDTAVSIDPTTLSTPVKNLIQSSHSNFLGTDVRDNNLFDLGINLSYKIDWLSAYASFVKNLGSVDVFTGVDRNGHDRWESVDYTGFMIDAGVTYFCGPWTVNLGGFYTTGPEFDKHPESFSGAQALKEDEVNWFTYPLATAKYFSEIIGGGVLGDDLYVYRGYKGGPASGKGGASTLDQVYWRGYGFPTNLWTITLGGSWQATPTTKLSASYWYFGTSEEVPVRFKGRNINGVPYWEFSNSIGHELNFYLDQKIVDGLTLTLVGAYLFADDAFAPVPTDAAAGQAYTKNLASDAYEVGARLQWSF